ncbi:MAG: gamma-glutamylcyclotransferase [Planctomycetes bacterium]|nr:gamma-glutamylcyclotransferase [Planctomycetota bacterium]
MSQHRLLEGQEFLGPARTLPGYRLYDFGPYPCLVTDPSGGLSVEGELYRVEVGLLPRLDEYEGAPDLFVRQEVAVEGVSAPVWAYLFQGDVAGLPACEKPWRPRPVSPDSEPGTPKKEAAP